MISAELQHPAELGRGIAPGLARTLGATVGIQGLGVLSGALLARALGVENRGILAAVILWPSIVAYVGDLGGSMAIAYFAASSPDLKGRLPGIAVASALVQGVALLALGAPVLAVALQPHPEEIPLALIYLVGFVPVNLLTRYLNAIHQGEGRFDRFNRVRITVQASSVVGVTVLSVAGAHSVLPFLLVYLVSNGLALLAAATGVRPRSIIPQFDARWMRRGLAYGLKAHVGNLTPVDSFQLDLLVVIAFLDPHTVGLYAVAVSGAMLIRAQGTALGMVAMPSVAALTNASAKADIVGTLFRLSLLTSGALALAVAALAPQLLMLVYGSAYVPAAPVLRILAVGVVAASLRQVLGDCLRGMSRPATASFVEMIALAVAIPCLFATVPRFGVTGAALSIGASYIVALLTSLVLVVRAGIPLRDLLSFGRKDVALVWHVAQALARLIVAPVGKLRQLAGVDCLGRLVRMVGLVRWARRVAVAGMFVLVGSAVALASPGPMVGLVAATVLLSAGPIVPLFFGRRFDPFEPVYLFAVSYAVLFAIRPAFDLTATGGIPLVAGRDPSAGYATALLIAIVGALAFYSGYYSRFGERIARRVPLPTRSLEAAALAVFAGVVVILGVAAYGAFLVTSGGISALSTLLLGRSADASSLLSQPLGYLYSGLQWLSSVGILLLAFSPSWRSRRALTGLVLLLVSQVMNVADGSRSWTLPVAAAVALLWYLRRGTRPAVRTIVALLAAAFVMGVLLPSAYRNASSRPDTVAATVSNLNQATGDFFTGGDTAMVADLAVAVQYIPQVIPYQLGTTYVEALTRPFPRALWPGKPVAADTKLMDTIWPELHGVVSFSFSGFSEPYMNLGIPGVAIFGLLFGTLWAALFRWLQRAAKSPFAQAIFAVSLPFLLIYIRGGLGTDYQRQAILLGPILLGVLYARTRSPDRVVVGRVVRGAA